MGIGETLQTSSVKQSRQRFKPNSCFYSDLLQMLQKNSAYRSGCHQLFRCDALQSFSRKKTMILPRPVSVRNVPPRGTWTLHRKRANTERTTSE
jgi:hypothetical protein